MAASVRRIIRKALPEINQSKDATTKGKSRGRAFTKKKRTARLRIHKEALRDILAGLN